MMNVTGRMEAFKNGTMFRCIKLTEDVAADKICRQNTDKMSVK